MRLYRYLSSSGGFQPRLAVGIGDAGPVDLVDAWNSVTGTRLRPEDASWLVSTEALIESGPEVWAEVADVARAASADESLHLHEGTQGLRWLAPLARPASLRDFLAFEDHVERGAERRGTEVPDYWYEAPVYYKGNHRAILGPGDECKWPSYTDYMDFELELAMIVGRRGHDIETQRAAEHIFGFTIFNDLSARDIQVREMGAWLGPAKGKDFANAFGPCIVTVDEVGPEPDLAMACRVNGEEWGRARSSDMHWRWADMIAHASAGEDVYPGDIYGSGTPGGCCGLDLGKRLEPGDVVELEIEKIGTLTTPIGPRP